jgi:hypothetical protein
MQRLIVAVALALLAGIAQSADEAITGCEPKDGLEPICGIGGSEDLEVLDDHHLLISQSHVRVDANHGMQWQPGSLGLLDLRTRDLRVLYPGAARGNPAWGDVACAGEIGAALSPHGIHLARRGDGKLALLVVNHGARNTVEMFELLDAAAMPRLAWRGCVRAPEHAFLNDVAGLADGGFLVTMMMDERDPLLARKEAERDADTGYVLRWRMGAGFQRLPGTDAPLPNGIQLSRDGNTFFVSTSSAGGAVRKHDLASGKLLGTAIVSHPDNLSWASDGRLLAAGLQANAITAPCFADFGAPCGAAFNVFAIDPVGLHAELLLAHEGAPMGLATVAVQAGGNLYLGSAAGERILRAPLPGAH